MSSFKDFYLTEKHKKSFIMKVMGKDETVEVFEDPTTNEFRDLKKASGRGNYRLGISDKSKPEIFAWRVDVLHDEMRKHLDFDMGILYRPNKTPQMEFFNDVHNFVGWDKLKKKKQIVKALHKKFPKADFIYVYNDWDEDRYVELKTGKVMNTEEWAETQ